MENLSMLNNIHVAAVALLLLVIVVRAMTLFKGTLNHSPNPKAWKVFVALQHSALTLIVVTGVIALFLKEFQVETWFYAKIILFLVMLSSLIKAYKKDDRILLIQRRVGWGLALVAFFAILGLVMLKPSFG